jgi:hypothetical protein
VINVVTCRRGCGIWKTDFHLTDRASPRQFGSVRRDSRRSIYIDSRSRRPPIGSGRVVAYSVAAMSMFYCSSYDVLAAVHQLPNCPASGPVANSAPSEAHRLLPFPSLIRGRLQRTLATILWMGACSACAARARLASIAIKHVQNSGGGP